MAERMAGSEAVLPQVMAAMGLVPRQTVPSGAGWVDRNRKIPGNSFIFPDQKTQVNAGEAEWSYPLFRQDLVDAGLLPQKAPPGNPQNIDLPAGMTVLEAIRSGLIR